MLKELEEGSRSIPFNGKIRGWKLEAQYYPNFWDVLLIITAFLWVVGTLRREVPKDEASWKLPKLMQGICQKQKQSPWTSDSESCAQKFIQDFTTAASACSHPAPSPTAAWISASEPGQDQQHSVGSLGTPGTFWISLGLSAGFVFAREHVWGRKGCLYFSISEWTLTLDSIWQQNISPLANQTAPQCLCTRFSLPLLKGFQLFLRCMWSLCHSFPALTKLGGILFAAFILSGCLPNLLFLFFNLFF